MARKPTKNVSAGWKATPSVTDRRKAMKYKVSTSSLTSSGVVPIKGVDKYPAEPAIYFTREAWVKQCHLVAKCGKEVGWFALVDHDERDNSFTITELVIPNQEVTAAETDIGKEDLADAAMELIEQGKDTSKMYAWFHSHVNMGVSPSPQDEYQVEDFLEDLADQPEVPAFIRGIQNKKGDLKLDVYYVQHGIAYQNVPFNVIHDDDPAWLTDIEGQIRTKVKERTYGGFGGSRQTAGKSQNLAGSGNNRHRNGRENGAYVGGWDTGVGFRGGYYDDDDIYDTWGLGYNSYDDDYGVDDKDSPSDDPNAPKPKNVPNNEYVAMEVVYRSPQNIEVLLDMDNQLWVCGADGEIYDYAKYTEYYGEIDGDVFTSQAKQLALVQG